MMSGGEVTGTVSVYECILQELEHAQNMQPNAMLMAV